MKHGTPIAIVIWICVLIVCIFQVLQKKAPRDPFWAYKVLELDMCKTTISDIKARFRELSHVHHPDKGGDAEKWREMIEARDNLLANHESYARWNCDYPVLGYFRYAWFIFRYYLN